MSNIFSTGVSLPIDQQIDHLSELTLQLRSTLKTKSDVLPSRTLQNLAHIGKSLKKLGKKVTLVEEQRNSLLALVDISQLVNSTLDLNEVLRITMDTIVRLTGAERGFLMLRDENGEMLIRIARNWEQESINASEFAISHTVIDRAASAGEAVLTTNAQEDPRFGGQESIIAYSLRSILCVPLKVKDVVTGVIYADNRIRTGLFTDSEKELLTAFANQAAIALENARLFESVRQTLAEVTELKNLMDNVFASIASGVITANIEDKIMLANRAATNILGRRESELLGLRLQDSLPPLADQLSPHIKSARTSDQQIIGQEIRFEKSEEQALDLSFNISPLKDAERGTQGVAIVVDDLTEKKRLEAQRRMFERMVSPAVIDMLDPDQVQMGGKRGAITAVFADIRGFTSFSENLEPEELVAILNQYLAAAADAVLEEQGTIDKFMGDAIMAWYNAPIPQPDHTLRAVRSALKIRDAIKQLHDKFPPEHRLSFGVGIHYGDAVLGLVGTELRLEYTAIGDSVNTAKRIQENSAANQILISAPAYEFVRGQVDVREVAPVNAKGKREPIPVFEVLGLL